MFYRVYLDEVKTNGRRDFAVDLVMAMDRALRPKWLDLDESDDMGDVTDARDLTEIFRRLGGFLTITSGIIAPLQAPSEEEREAKELAERAEFVIGRVVSHLQCNNLLYTKKYLHYLAEVSEMHAIWEFVANLIKTQLTTAGFQKFDPFSSYLDGNQIIVPLRFSLSDKQLQEVLRERDGDDPLGHKKTIEITTPADGFHLEMVTGNCVLQNVPPQSETSPIPVVVETAESE
jgi:hypothetical protein